MDELVVVTRWRSGVAQIVEGKYTGKKGAVAGDQKSFAASTNDLIAPGRQGPDVGQRMKRNLDPHMRRRRVQFLIQLLEAEESSPGV